MALTGHTGYPDYSREKYPATNSILDKMQRELDTNGFCISESADNPNRAGLKQEFKLIIPDGIKYDAFPTWSWKHIMEFERLLFPFGVVRCRMDTKPYSSQTFEAIVVDQKTFHCLLGGRWILNQRVVDTMTPNQWASQAIGELLAAYKRTYKL